MNRVQEAVPNQAGPGQEVPDRRQRKKLLTKDALVAAALELFAAKGYDHTAVHAITDAVDVSERTFFRYFASKEDLVLSFIAEGATAFAAALAARPAAYLRHTHDQDHKVIEVLARREGVDPATDRRPRVLAAVIGALVFLSDRDWRAGDNPDPEAMGATFDAYVDAVVPALSGHWDAGTSSTTLPTARPSAT